MLKRIRPPHSSSNPTGKNSVRKGRAERVTASLARAWPRGSHGHKPRITSSTPDRPLLLAEDELRGWQLDSPKKNSEIQRRKRSDDRVRIQPRRKFKCSAANGRVKSCMHQCTADPTGRIIALSYSGVVRPKEVRQSLETVRILGGTVRPGFVLFNDLTHIDSMDPECAPVLGEIMEQCTKMGVGASLRVIPSAKAIGVNLIAQFHYPRTVRSHTYETLSEGLNAVVSSIPAE
jgi:hypothetical protein